MSEPRTIRNAACNTLAWGVPVLLAFCFTPYIVHKLGNDAYGVLTLVWSVVGYFAFLDLGLGHAVTKFVAEHNARCEPALVDDIVGTALLLTVITGVAGGAVIMVLAHPLATRWLTIPPELVHTVQLALCLSGVGFFLGMLQNLLKAIPDGHSRYDISSAVAILYSCICTLGSVLLLRCGAGLLEIVILNIAAALVAIVAYGVAAKRLSPQLTFRPTVRPTVMRKVINFGCFTLLSRVSYVTVRHLDRVLIAALLGISSVTYYAIPVMLVGRLTALTQRMGIVLFPAVSALQGRGEDGAIAELFVTSSRILITVAATICLPLLFFGPRFLALWMTPEFAAHAAPVMVFVTLASLVDAATAIPTFFINGLGHPRISGLFSVGNAAVFLALITPLAKLMGIRGVALALLISNSIITPSFILYACRWIVGVKLGHLFLKSFLAPLCAMALTGTLLSVLPISSITSMPLLLLMMGVASMLFLGTAALCGGFTREELRIAVDFLNRLRSWTLPTRRTPK